MMIGGTEEEADNNKTMVFLNWHALGQLAFVKYKKRQFSTRLYVLQWEDNFLCDDLYIDSPPHSVCRQIEAGLCW